MAISYQIDPAAKLVHTKVNGRINLEDLLSHSYLLKNDPQFKPEYSNLIDLSGFSGADLNLDSMRAFAQGLQGKVFAHSARRAVVAPADAAFDLSRQFQSMRTDNENFQVFHSMGEALHWLNLASNKVLFE